VSPSTESVGELRVPRETVNDDLVTIQRWTLRHGESVHAGDVVAIIETSKAAVEIEADRDGYIETICPEGAEVAVGELIGRIQPAPTEPGQRRETSQPPAGDNGAPLVTISVKAQRLMDQHNVDAAVFAGRGLRLVRESDVIKYLEELVASNQPPKAKPASQQLAAAETEAQLASRLRQAKWKKRGIFGDIKASAGERGRSIVWLMFNYIWRNWMLGLMARVAPRGMINTIHRWRGVKVGADCFIDPSAVLETAYPELITIGNDVLITVNCVIMTHIKASQYLRDTGIMPAVFKPVKLMDHCFIGVNSTIMPGVTVGEAAVVASGSVVVGNVPPYTMVAGNPAKVVKRFPRPDAKE
jgi:acetyltransferase-like isoleucine patch superfamily enzyme